MDDVSKSALIGGLIFANAAAIVGAYVSIKTAITRLETKFERAEEDINNLWNKFRGKSEN